MKKKGAREWAIQTDKGKSNQKLKSKEKVSNKETLERKSNSEAG